jgi:Group II intron, maturase-specific domain
MYHRHVVSKAHFTSVDAHIWRLLWKWAMRRHPTKGTGWVKNKYFRVEGNRSWAFTARSQAHGVTRLFRAAAVPIVRHVAYFAEAGHAFRLKPDRCFARSWTAGAQRRRGFCFYSDCWFSVKLIFSFRIDSPFMLIR